VFVLWPAGVPTISALAAANPDGTVQDVDGITVMLFDWVDGAAPTAEDVPSFVRLGAVSARMHEHARRWARPSSFTRFSWDYSTTLGPDGHWGRWQDGIGVGPAERAVLGRLDAALAARLRKTDAIGSERGTPIDEGDAEARIDLVEALDSMRDQSVIDVGPRRGS